ncbi:unnamed protein product [Knipowitschia caucasica]
MSGRCAVKTLAEFGFGTTRNTSRITLDSEDHAFISGGNEEIYLYNIKDKKLTGILQFPTSVNYFVQSEDKQHLYVACASAVYGIKLHHEPIRSSPNESPADIKITSDNLIVREEGVLCLVTVGTVLVTLSRKDNFWCLTVTKPGEEPGLFITLSLSCIPAVGDVTDETRPVMQCIHLHDTSSSPESSLDPTLFKLLFSIDSALSQTPVILCGLPDGRLCSLSLCLPGFRVIHSLEEPVLFIGASVVMETEPGPDARCLVAVGERGRVVVIKTCEGATEERIRQVSFTECCVSEKVMSACVDKSCLFLSTGSDLLSINLTDTPTRERGKRMNTPVSLNVCRIIALTKPASKTTGDFELLCLSDKGHLQSITLPLVQQDGECSRQPPTQGGRSVKDLLSAIGDVCERASNLNISIKSKNQILRRLNQVANVCLLLWSDSEQQDHPIRCVASAQWRRLLQEDSLHLSCVLENTTPYLLEHGWTLNISVSPLSVSPQHNTSTNYSFPFCNLNPEQTFEVTLPLTAADDKLFPITISCVLVFSLGGLFDEKQLASLLKVQNSTISLPLNILSVDWLHALRLTPSFNQKRVTTLTRINSSMNAVQMFLKSKGRNKAEQSENRPYSASLQMSVDFLKQTLASKSAQQEASINVCVTFLDWLLCEAHRGVSGHVWEHANDTAVLHAEGPNRQLVKVMVKEVEVGVGQDSMAAVEVQVESLCLGAVCGLHHAILERVQTLVKRAPSTSSAVSAETLGLRAALQRAEHSLRLVQDSVCRAVSVGVSSGQMTSSLVKVYEDLRKHPLVIL